MNRENRAYWQGIRDDELMAVAGALAHWLQKELGATVTESRARALLVGVNQWDEGISAEFGRVINRDAGLRIALFDLCVMADLQPERILSAQRTPVIYSDWIALGVAAFAQKMAYPIDELNPSSPPTSFSPAGQLLQQTGHWIKRQIQRTTSEQEQLAAQLGFVSSPTTPAPVTSTTVVRPSLPVRHFEFNKEITVQPDDLPSIAATPSPPLTISSADIPIDPVEQIKLGEARRVPRPKSEPINSISIPSPSLAERIPEIVARSWDQVNQVLHPVQDTTEIPTTRLRVNVYSYPNGDGVPAVQVVVRPKNTKSSLAAVTNDNGAIAFRLPVRINGSDMTYEARVTWPQSFGGHTERKLITVSTAMPEFVLNFYARV